MNYYRLSFCNNKFFPLFLASLAVLFYILPSDAEAVVYDVTITNNSVDVNVESMPNNAYDFFNSAYDTSQFDDNDIQFGDDSPQEALNATGTGGQPYDGALQDFQATSEFIPNNSTSDNPLLPVLSGRNPLGLTGRYFNFSITGWLIGRSIGDFNYNTTPLETHRVDQSQNYRVKIRDSYLIANVASKNSFFNFTQFKTDLITALIGNDNFQFFVRLVNAINSTPSSANFSYTVPSVFGFDTGFIITIPFHDILHGSGDWYSFSTVISLFRSMLSVVYYLCVVNIVIRCIFIYN